MTEEEWENICDGCGKCCAFINTNIACPSLNTETNRCTVYKNRLSTELCCTAVTPDNVLTLHKKNVLPDSCAYVRFLQGKPPLDKIEPARLLPFTLADIELQNRYIKNRAEWRKKI